MAMASLFDAQHRLRRISEDALINRISAFSELLTEEHASRSSRLSRWPASGEMVLAQLDATVTELAFRFDMALSHPEIAGD